MRNFIRSVRGFTVIELMIVVAIIGILAAVAIPAFQNKGQPKQSDGSKCKAGFKFVNDRQLIGPNGGGVPCDTINQPSSGPQPLK